MSSKIWIPGGNNQIKTIEKHLTKRVVNKEAIVLYREILRTIKHFHWVNDSTGKPWNIILKEQTRKEFKESKQETDPLIIARMLITGRDCLQQIQLKFNDATNAAWKRIETDNNNSTKR